MSSNPLDPHSNADVHHLPTVERRALGVHPRYARVPLERLCACLAVEAVHLTPEGLAAVSWAFANAVVPDADPADALPFAGRVRR
jgi:hypothetical protein